MNVLDTRVAREKFKVLVDQYFSNVILDETNGHYGRGVLDCEILRRIVDDSLVFKVLTRAEGDAYAATIDAMSDAFAREDLGLILDSMDSFKAVHDAFGVTLRSAAAAVVETPQGLERSHIIAISRYRKRYYGQFARFQRSLMEALKRFQRATTTRNAGAIIDMVYIFLGSTRSVMEYGVIAQNENNEVTTACGMISRGVEWITRGGAARQKGYAMAGNGVRLLNEAFATFETSFGGLFKSKVSGMVSKAVTEIAPSTTIDLHRQPEDYIRRVVFVWKTKRTIEYGPFRLEAGPDGVYQYDYGMTIPSGYVPEAEIRPFLDARLGIDELNQDLE